MILWSRGGGGGGGEAWKVLRTWNYSAEVNWRVPFVVGY